MHWLLIGHALYLGILGWAGIRLASRRLGRLLQP
jgi:hypothetical protein